MIHIFHGFLGSPEDFSFLKREDVRLHDLYETNDITISPEDILIGYSMGGRLALEMASKVHFQLKKLILLSAHPGLSTDTERKEREVFEKTVLKKLEEETQENYLKWWNSLTIFSHDRPIEIHNKKQFEKAHELFKSMRLSEQKNYIPEIISHRKKVLWVVGQSDEKYMKLATEVLQPLDLDFITIKGGHRLFQNKEELKQVFSDQGIL